MERAVQEYPVIGQLRVRFPYCIYESPTVVIHLLNSSQNKHRVLIPVRIISLLYKRVTHKDLSTKAIRFQIEVC
jgi:hypothetical protein